MKKIYVVILALLMLSLLIPMYAFAPVKAEARSDVDLTFYGSPDAAYTALTAGQADFLVWALTKEQKDAAELNPNVQICRVDEQGMYEFDLNNNYTILSYPGVRSATNELKVRQAIAHLTDKQFIVANILLYFGTRIDAPMSATSAAQWADPSVAGDNYPYPYDPEEAAAKLAEAGFSDSDSNGWLNYPADWDGAPGADTTVYPLVVCVRSDHGHRLAAGQYLINQLTVTLAATSIGAGFATTGVTWQQPRSVLSPKVMGNRDYNIYTGGWSVGRFPTHLFFLFHSMFWYPYGSSYVTGMNSLNLPNYPAVDTSTAAIWYTATMETAKTASKAFTVMHAEKCLNVPLWAYSSYWAYRKTLVGVVNEDGYGIENDYTFMNAYRVDVPGAPIRVAVTNGPDRLNVLYSQWYFEYSMLNRVYTGGLNVQPYDLAVDVPWVVQDWEVGTWDDAGTPKSLVTYYIRKDVGIVTPVTGDYVRKWDAHDFEFSIWYNYAFSDSWQWGSFMDVRFTKIVDVNLDGWDEFQVYFDDASYWFYSAPLYPFLTKPELLDQLNDETTESWAQAGTAEYTLANNVVQVVNCTLDGVPLVEGTQYVIRAGYDRPAHDTFVPLVPLVGTINIWYWYADIPATGFYLGALPWQHTILSLATHYPASVTTDPPGIGDTFVLKKNMFFFLQQPLLGEIDFAWKWASGAKPRGGSFKIEIFDVVRATGAYCTRGDGVFNPKYFPGADLDASDLCHIGIFDLVSITGKYGKSFGAPPNFDPELMDVGQGHTSATSIEWLGLKTATVVGSYFIVNLQTTGIGLGNPTGVVTATLIDPLLSGYGKGYYVSGGNTYNWVISVKASPDIMVGGVSAHQLADVGQGHNTATSLPIASLAAPASIRRWMLSVTNNFGPRTVTATLLFPGPGPNIPGDATDRWPGPNYPEQMMIRVQYYP